MFFKSNINRIRKAVIGYLIEEGFKAEMENGLIVVDLDEWHYIIDFDLEKNIPGVIWKSESAVKNTKHWNSHRRLSLQTRLIRMKTIILW